MSSPSRVGLFGGSFNPVHHGHLILARRVREHFDLDEVRLVVSARPPHKPAIDRLAPFEHRLSMVKAAVEGETGLSACGIEGERAGPSYTFDTVAALEQAQPQATWFWIIGADTLPELPSWHRGEALLERLPFITIAREGFDCEAALAEIARRSSAQAVERLRSLLFVTPAIGISATEVRARARRGLSLRYLVPDGVAHLIAGHALYRS